ncbi:antibiotic biosynthesis monooxygenase family protein [Aliibacillus thermotolerans]|uniref:Antibiotic biosynthesis monooxygenase family protein n=1 Tax=Aliibacillus thermotolerans TaxID=1834418 RepID=A0ABW0U6Z2_9BACI|nr:antibiotic biosynthesis monooxygenase family protein [Aliibacillus thermotolerans]MDA3128547.1 antibiotic biosynthesis monooxygenase [Aliibacillus thermotolerans]
MYVVMNELKVPKEMKEVMKERFAQSADNMKKVPGCLDYMFLDEEDGRQVVFTKWESKQHYEDWTNSEAFQRAHQDRSGKEKKSPASGNELRTFEVIHHF